jgi:phage repressor protein C with HTH and peptisase S24 domain
MKSRKTSTPEWARRILGLRRRMELTQAAFASRLHYSAMALSRWERGTHEPPAQAYIQIGNLVGEPDSSWFWERAGFRGSDLSKMVPEGRSGLRKAAFPDLEIVVAGTRRKGHAAGTKARLVAIPVLTAAVATYGAKGDPSADLDNLPSSEMIAAPAVWCPHPADTSCLRVRGSSMSPMINENDIVAVDRAETNPTTLSGKIVVTWQRETGLTLSRFLLVNGVQLLESENREYEAVRLGKNRSWQIIGKVLWWIRQAP